MAAVSFDHLDKDSWYFGNLSRIDAQDILMAEREGGVFLVRDSGSIRGDYVLCVRENSKVSHYIINKIQQGDQMRYRIGDQMFTDLPALLNFYKVHYLDTTPLIRPAPKRVLKVRAKYDFEGSDPDDLPFKKGEILTIVSKDEEQWWTARNSLGQTGSIPVPYIQKVDESQLFVKHSNNYTPRNTSSPPTSHQTTNSETNDDSGEGGESGGTLKKKPSNNPALQRKLPAFARVKQARVPNAYDKTALRLEIGNIVKVTKMSINGNWEGELNGKVGHFPFTHVELIDNAESGIEEDS